MPVARCTCMASRMSRAMISHAGLRSLRSVALLPGMGRHRSVASSPYNLRRLFSTSPLTAPNQPASLARQSPSSQPAATPLAPPAATASTSPTSGSASPASSASTAPAPSSPAPPPPAATPASSPPPGSSQPLPPSPPPADPPSSSSSRRSPRGPISWKSVGVMVVVLGGLLAYYNYEKERRQSAFQPVVSIGRAAIGGDFELVSADGLPVSSTGLRGQYLMLYFGFTHCPDICPTELRKMEEALAAFHSRFPQPEQRIRPVFISIDPHRDSPERLRAYRQQWSPSFLFLTGSPADIKKVARAYRVYYSAPEGGADDYLVDHSIFFYLIDRQGEVMDFFGKNLTADEIAGKLCRIIPDDNATSKSTEKQ